MDTVALPGSLIFYCEPAASLLPLCMAINQPSKGKGPLCQPPLIDYSALGKCTVMNREPNSIRMPSYGRQQYVGYTLLSRIK